MPKLSEHHAGERSRILLVGDPGTGKSAAYGSLLEHKQRLFVADFDDGLDSIRAVVDPKYYDNLVFATLKDAVKFDAIKGIPRPKGKPTAFSDFIKLMGDWVDTSTGESYGAPESWDSNTWLVIDSLSALGTAAMWYTLHQNNRLGEGKRMKDWGNAIDRIDGVVQMLVELPINFVVCAHLMHLTPKGDGDDDAQKSQVIDTKRYPATLGQKLPPRLGAYFNVVVQSVRVGHGKAAKYMLKTKPEQDVDVKVPVAAGKLPVELENTKLYDIVKALRNPR